MQRSCCEQIIFHRRYFLPFSRPGCIPYCASRTWDSWPEQVHNCRQLIPAKVQLSSFSWTGECSRIVSGWLVSIQPQKKRGWQWISHWPRYISKLCKKCWTWSKSHCVQVVPLCPIMPQAALAVTHCLCTNSPLISKYQAVLQVHEGSLNAIHQLLLSWQNITEYEILRRQPAWLAVIWGKSLKVLIHNLEVCAS